MEISNLHFELRIKSNPLKKGAFRVSHIQQIGAPKPGWGTANDKGPKIYILSLNKGKTRELIYVGITNQPLNIRFIQGLTAVGKNGYHGYHWKELANKDESKIIDLFVYKFDNKERTESIEAEIVYLIRNKTGKWPEYQTEIHFHQANDKEILIAKQIYEHVSLSK